MNYPEATVQDLERHCAVARKLNLAAVSVNTSYIEHARHFLEGSNVKTVAAVNFPFGAADADTKRYETEVAVDNGAQEIEVVINAGRLRAGEAPYVLRELRDVAEAADERVVTMILESSLLTEAEILSACQLVLDSGAHYVQTATGWRPYEVTPGVIKQLREVVGPNFGIQACGSIHTLEQAVNLIEASADRITSAKALEILESLQSASASAKN